MTTTKIKSKLRNVINTYRDSYVNQLHIKAKNKMDNLYDVMRDINTSLAKPPVPISNLVDNMNCIRDVVDQEMTMEQNISPVLEM